MAGVLNKSNSRHATTRSSRSEEFYEKNNPKTTCTQKSNNPTYKNSTWTHGSISTSTSSPSTSLPTQSTLTSTSKSSNPSTTRLLPISPHLNPKKISTPTDTASTTFNCPISHPINTEDMLPFGSAPLLLDWPPYSKSSKWSDSFACVYYSQLKFTHINQCLDFYLYIKNPFPSSWLPFFIFLKCDLYKFEPIWKFRVFHLEAYRLFLQRTYLCFSFLLILLVFFF
jgi:hypothetical protein